MVLANKQDLGSSQSASSVAEKLGLHMLRDREWYVQGTSAVSGDHTHTHTQHTHTPTQRRQKGKCQTLSCQLKLDNELHILYTHIHMHNTHIVSIEGIELESVWANI